MGDFHTSDGRLMGDLAVQTVTCTNGQCNIPMKAPSFALVFLNDDVLNAITPTGPGTATFATTVTTKVQGTAFVAPSVLATSNGQGGAQEALHLEGATSFGSVPNSAAVTIGVPMTIVFGSVIGAMMVFLSWR